MNKKINIFPNIWSIFNSYNCQKVTNIWAQMNFKWYFSSNLKMYALKYGAFCWKWILCSSFGSDDVLLHNKNTPDILHISEYVRRISSVFFQNFTECYCGYDKLCKKRLKFWLISNTPQIQEIPELNVIWKILLQEKSISHFLKYF